MPPEETGITNARVGNNREDAGECKYLCREVTNGEFVRGVGEKPKRKEANMMA